MRKRVFLVFTVLIGLVACVGSEDPDCFKELSYATNADGTRAARSTVYVCGGATVRHYTHLTLLLGSTTGGMPSKKHLLTARGWVDLRLNWASINKLEVSYPRDLDGSDILDKLTNWSDVEIVYMPQTKPIDPKP